MVCDCVGARPEIEHQLAALPKPPGFDHLQPAGDQLPERTESAKVKDLVAQMRKVADEAH